MKKFLLCVSLLSILFANCASDDKPGKKSHAATADSAARADRFSQLFTQGLADGFSFPFGDGKGSGDYVALSDHKKHSGWYIATKTGESYRLGIHTGEDWNGNGGGDSDFGQAVYATASGKVLAAKDYGAPWGNVVYIEHRYIENAVLKTVYSLYAHLNELKVKKGDAVTKRQQVGTIGTGHGSFPAHLHFEIRKESMSTADVTYWPGDHGKDAAWVLRNYHQPSDFIKAHFSVTVPSAYDTLLVAEKSNYRLNLVVKGKKVTQYDIALSQQPLGHKQVEGDNRLPEGEYWISEKNRGPFYGTYKDFFGPAWMRISYPNRYDADSALVKNRITKQQYTAIANANRKKVQPPKNTGIGGGIGIHGWAGSWPEGKRHLTWGCISMKNKELDKFYELVAVGTPIIILP